MPQRPKTQNAGAALERQATTARIKRIMVNLPKDSQAKRVCDMLLSWLSNRTYRADKAAGGLGRKHPKAAKKS